MHNHFVALFRRQSIDLFHPHASKLPQRSRITTQMHIIRLSYDTTHVGGHKSASIFYISFQRLHHSILHHVKHRCNDQFILAEICVARYHIYGNIPVIEILVILMDMSDISQVDRRSARILQSPIVVPVEHNPDLCLIAAVQYRITQSFQFSPQLSDFSKYACILRPRVGDHRSMEFLTGTDASAQLEKLDRIRSVRYRLITLCPHLSRPFQGIIRLPVLLAWRLLHQHERRILQPSHQIMAHGCLTPRRIIPGIIVPGDNIHLLRPFEIVQPFKSTHQISRDRRLLVKNPNGFPLTDEIR